MQTCVILQPKIELPLLADNYIPRNELMSNISALLRNGSCKAVIINAGLGYGKTSFMSSYAACYCQKTAWYHLDSFDNDLSTFMQYLCASISHNCENFKFNFSEYLPIVTDNKSVTTFAMHFVKSLHEAGSGELVIMLDDFQEIYNEEILSVLDIAIKYLPKNIKFFFACRSMEDMYFSKHILTSDIKVVTQDSLKFTKEEMRTFIKPYTAADELDRTAGIFYGHFEGWPAGVMFLRLILLANPVDLAEHAEKYMIKGSALYNYIASEIFRKLPYELQDFLTRTSIFEILSADACDHVLGISNSLQTLEYLCQNNYFTTKIKNKKSAYRYHLAFKMFLNEHLTPTSKKDLCEKTSQYYIYTENKELAVEYAILSGNKELVCQMIEYIGMDTLQHRQISTLTRWFGYISDNGIQLGPHLNLLKGSYYSYLGKFNKAEDYIDRAINMFSQSMDTYGYIKAVIEKARIVRNHLGYRESLVILNNLEAASEDIPLYLHYEIYAEKIHNMLLTGDISDAVDYGGAMINKARRLGSLQTEKLCTYALCGIYFFSGDFNKAIECFESAPDASDENAVHTQRIYAGIIYSLTGDFEKGMSVVEKEFENANMPKSNEDLWIIYLMHAMLCTQIFHWRDAKDEDLAAKASHSFERAMDNCTICGQNMAFHSHIDTLKKAYYLYGRKDANGLKLLLDENADNQPFVYAVTAFLCSRAHYACGCYKSAVEISELNLAHAQKYGFGAMAAFSHLLIALARIKENIPCEQHIEGFIRYAANNRLYGIFQDASGLTVILQKCQELNLELSFIQSLSGNIDPSSYKIKISMFGEFSATLPNISTPVKWRTKKTMELFAYLYHMKKGVFKDKLLLDLWGDLSPKQSTSILHTTLYNLRKSFDGFAGHNIIIFKDKKYSLNRNLLLSELDAFNEVLKASAKKDFAKACEVEDYLNIYTGEYLENIDSDWANNDKFLYETKYIDARQALAEYYIDLGLFEKAVFHLRKALQIDPLREKIHLLLMVCYNGQNEKSLVIRQFSELTTVLKDELDADPEPETLAVYKSLCIPNCLPRRAAKQKIERVAKR